MSKKETVAEAIKRINKEIGSNRKAIQEHILLEEPERQLFIAVKHKLGLGKPRGLAVACQYMLEQVEREEKTDGDE